MDIRKLTPAFILLLLCISYNSCSKDEIDNITDNDYAKICERASDIDYIIVSEYVNKSKSLDDLMKHADEIKAIKGVEDVYSNGTTTMFVKIKDFRTISYSYYPEPEEETIEQEHIMQSQLKGVTKAQNDGIVYNNQDKVGMDMLIVNTTSQENRPFQNEIVIPGIKERFEKAGFQEPRIENSPNVEFFRNGIFDCDYLFLITHGHYDSKTKLHWMKTSEVIPRDAKGKIDPKFYENYKNYPDNQVTFDYKCVYVSDIFIGSSSRQFKHPGKAIVFNVACQSMKASENSSDTINNSLAEAFKRNGAGAYLGYDEENNIGHRAGLEFWTRMLSGMSVKSAYDDLSFVVRHNYMVENGISFWADLELDVSQQMEESCINQPEITYIDSSDDSGLKIDLYAKSFIDYIFTTKEGTYFYEGEDMNNLFFRYGFELSKTDDFTDVISLGKKSIGDEGCTWDTDYMISLTQSLTYNVNEPNSVIEPETTYWARAYVYDGTGYCYSHPVSFTTGEYSRIDNVIPPEIRNQMDPYITIYDGNTPPNIEGEYLMSPDELVYNSVGDYEPGTIFNDLYFKFYNQNMHNNTLDYMEKQGASQSTGAGAFISGSGNNFSVFFNTEGFTNYSDYTVNFKTALVISGTKDEGGIKNLQYAFVLVDKSNDPKPHLIPIGGFRVFKDGDNFSPLTTWAGVKKYIKKVTSRPSILEKRKKK